MTALQMDLPTGLFVEEHGGPMRSCIIRELIKLNNGFYAEHADSFSATRAAPWEGWQRAIDTARHLGALDAREPRVLDLACGNLRFERFLARELEPAIARIDAIDNCPALAANPDLPAIAFHNVDILDELMACQQKRDSGLGAPAAPSRPQARLHIDTRPCDLSVCFGFMHHVPGIDLRKCVLDELLARTRPGGVVAVSLWQFMKDDRLVRKAYAADAMAREIAVSRGTDVSALEPGDHFLGWQDDKGPLRYCHHFSESEVDELADHAAGYAAEVARFSADGASCGLNRYLVLQRHEL